MNLTKSSRFVIKAMLITGLFTASLASAAETLRMVDGKDGVASYAKGVLRIILEKLPDQYEWEESTSGDITEARVAQMLIDDQLDIGWFSTTNDLEQRLHPIRIPIYKGLFGYRIFMIKEGNQHKFEGISSLTEIKNVSIGQGRTWADTAIMEANGIDVVKVSKYHSLFYMLDGDRFDAFPRGVHEPWYEMERYPDLALTVEDHLMLRYVNPYYLFVSKDRSELAAKLERGYQMAIEDGSFDEYFYNDPTVKNVIEKAKLSQRTVLPLKNPLLPKNTPVDDKKLWFDPSNTTMIKNHGLVKSDTL